MFGTVLIANRGEIALRVARSCRELGIRVIAVYSTEDRHSAVVRFADAAVHIGPAPARRSYLNIPALIEAARQTGADAVHPGYGFLSEDADFAEVCADNGFTFIGPRPDVLSVLGDKTTARRLMKRAGVPLLPGSTEAVDQLSRAEEVAAEIGFPVIIKAAVGGGGRGMRVVHEPGELARAYQETKANAQILFGDGRVYLERYLASARHVEIQILCDQHGNAVHLGERECSVQRRHQKLIEETPAPGLSEELRREMGAASLRGALAAGYTGIGTFEFLVDGDTGFYFMEVNPRVQVEHGITELVTGIDLVREQLRIAAGERLGITQDDVRLRGAAIECRINAEDPRRDFRPTPGMLDVFRIPGGQHTRVDTHGYPGYQVPPTYDSLLAKLMVWAPDREQALARMLRALGEFEVAGAGVHTTIDFLAAILATPGFSQGAYDTSLVDAVAARW